MNNEYMRIQFNEYRENNFMPQIKLIAKHIAVDRGYLSCWSKGEIDLSTKSLVKIDSFLNKYHRS